MNQRAIARLLASLSILTWFLCGCASVPTQEMSDARQALQAARAAGAETDAPESLRSTKQLLLQAEQALAFGDYGRARREAISAKEEAIKARTMAVAIGQAKVALANAQAQGHQLPAVVGVLGEAEAAARLGDASTAVRLAEQVRRDSENALSRQRP
jgi:hypothetical protein